MAQIAPVQRKGATAKWTILASLQLGEIKFIKHSVLLCYYATCITIHHQNPQIRYLNVVVCLCIQCKRVDWEKLYYSAQYVVAFHSCSFSGGVGIGERLFVTGLTKCCHPHPNGRQPSPFDHFWKCQMAANLATEPAFVIHDGEHVGWSKMERVVGGTSNQSNLQRCLRHFSFETASTR